MTVDSISNALYLIQMEEAKHKTLGSRPPGAGDFPYADPSDWSKGTSFDTNIPYKSDGSIDIEALLEKIRRILYFSNQGDPMDFNTQLDLVAFLMNIAGVWGAIKNQGGAAAVDNLLNMHYGKSGKSLLEELSPDMIESLIHGYFYKHGGDQNATAQFANAVINKLRELMGGGADFLKSLLDNAENLNSSLSQWMKEHTKNGKPDLTFDDFAFVQAFKWEEDFAMNPDAIDYLNACRHQEIDRLTAGIKDVFMLYMALMMVLTGETGDLQTQIGGRGDLLDTMSKGIGALSKKLLSEWTGGKFTGDSVKEFFQTLFNLEKLCKDKRFASIFSAVDKVFKDFTDPKSGLSVKDPVTGKDITLGELYQKIQSGEPGYSWDTMATALNSLAPSTGYPPITPPGFSEASNDFNSIVNQVTNASTVQGQMIQNLEGVSEKQLAMITAGLNNFVQPNKVIVQNMAAARG